MSTVGMPAWNREELESYLKAHHIDFPFRFDIIAIIYDDELSRVDHYEDAFRPRPKFYR